MRKNFIGSLELLLAAIIWGFAFVAQTEGADNIPVFTFNFSRSIIAAAFLGALLVIIKAFSKRKVDMTPSPASMRESIIGGVACGVALFVATSFQQYGISLYPEGAAASGRAGFITAIYVILVPLVSIFIGKKIHALILLGALIAVGGMYLLCFGQGLGNLYLGDLFVFLCAVSFCGHILVINKFTKNVNGITLSCIQFLTMAVLSAIAMLIFEPLDFSSVKESILPVLYLGIMSSGVAYTLQIVGQSNTEPTIASIVMSLESVFAAVGGWLLLGERLSAKELFGCALVFVAIIVAQIPEFISNKANNKT